jgi:hypothetical protein
MVIPISELAEQFPQDQVKQRRGNFGQQLSYLEASTVVQRLNEVLEGDWSFNVVESIVEVDEVVIRGRLTIGDTVREQFGGSKIKRNKDSGEIISLGDDLKSAASDALKKCASLVGVALNLHQGHQNNNGNGGSNGNGHRNPNQHNSGHNRIGNAQIARIFQSAKDVGIPQHRVINMARETFNTNISQLTPTEAEDLITLIGTAA